MARSSVAAAGCGRRPMPTDEDAFLGAYINDVRQEFAVLGTAEEEALSRRARDGDQEALHRVVKHHLLPTALLALELAPLSAPPLDAIQEANLVLLRLVERGLSGNELRSALADRLPGLFPGLWPHGGRAPP